jgi:precorrin-8X/cobalt-precorrin-8 methylmutase
MSAPVFSYEKDPDAIYRQSFEIVRADTDLTRFDPAEAEVAVRLVHASGMPEIAPDLIFSEGAVAAGRAALALGAPVICDAAMVAHGITPRLLPTQNEVVCLIRDPHLRALAKEEATTLSAAQVGLWREKLDGAVIAIGNAPTALFRLIELILDGGPRPAVILGFPVGFVGAAESKAALAGTGGLPPFLTLPGRRGGSAMASAAVNALAILAGKDAAT